MARPSLNKEMNIEVTARLIARGSDLPVTGNEFTVKLFDKDFFEDDFLGQSTLDENGKLHIIFNPSRLDINDPIRETSLDFYFVVFKNGNEIFKSKVMEDVDVNALEEFKMGKGELIDLGTFLIDVD
jgi:hypothetical protein